MLNFLQGIHIKQTNKQTNLPQQVINIQNHSTHELQQIK